MKNAIHYYYNLVTYDIRQIGKKFRFTAYDDEYLLCVCTLPQDELDELYKLDYALIQQGLYCHQIVLNQSGGVITYIHGEPYILMKMFITDTRKVTINDLLPFSMFTSTGDLKHLEKSNWRHFWMQKLDYFEEQLGEFGIKYPLIRESFHYFDGLTEMAISLLYQYSSSSTLVLSHRRIKKDMTLSELYNPLNFIFDVKVRDVAEYFKSIFFREESIFEQVQNYVMYANLTQDECYLFFVRFLYPSFYFDIYERIIAEKNGEEKVRDILDYIFRYESFLKSLYLYFRSFMVLPDIDWFIKA